MRVLLFSARPYDRREFTAANARIGHDLSFVEARLGAETLSLAAGYEAVCTFVNDTLDASVLRRLADGGTRLIALRCAGFNQVDVRAAAGLASPWSACRPTRRTRWPNTRRGSCSR